MVTYGGMAKQPVILPVVSLNLLNCIYGIYVYTVVLLSGLTLVISMFRVLSYSMM